MPEIKAINLTKYFKNKRTNEAVAALYKTNFIIPNHSFTAVLGPSGCGKTTLLKTIAGLYKIDDGTLYFDDKKINHIPTNKRNLSFISQEFALYPNMTIHEIISYPLKISKVPVDEIRQRVSDIAKLLSIEILLSRKPKVLSIGQQQRVVLAKALVKNPTLVLMDEPFSNLDEPTKIETIALLKKIHRSLRINFIMVTHRLTDVANIADHIMMMDNGEVIEQREVLRSDGQ